MRFSINGLKAFVVFGLTSAFLISCGADKKNEKIKPLTKAERLEKLPSEEQLQQRIDEYLSALNEGDVGAEGRYMPKYLVTNFANEGGISNTEFLSILREANVENRNKYEETVWKGDLTLNPIEASSSGDRKYKVIPFELLSRPRGQTNCITRMTMDVFAMTSGDDWYFVPIRNNHIYDVFKSTYKSLENIEFQPTSNTLKECR